MWKRLFLAGFFTLQCMPTQAYELRNEKKQIVGKVKASSFFKKVNQFVSTNPQVNTEPHKLQNVAIETLKFLESQEKKDLYAVQPGLFKEMGIKLTDVKRTLKKIIQTVNEDSFANRPSRLSDPKFIKDNFHLYRWKADSKGAKGHHVKPGKNGQIRLTKYVVFQAEGTSVKNKNRCCALYEVPKEELHLSKSAADANKNNLIRYKYTKQDIVSGALNGKNVKPLVWLSRQGLEDALMQGSIMVKMPDGSQRMFNVHRNNGIGYNRKIKNPRNQKRYWYFKEVKGVQGYGNQDKISLQPGVSFAGDVFNLGLGKLVAIEYIQAGKSKLKLGVIADTGGAFIPNLYQLDFFAGIFSSRKAYKAGVKHLPTYASAFILIAR